MGKPEARASTQGPGALRVDAPGCGGKDLQGIRWDDWFKAFA
jgi:hypothetical protein